MLELLAFLIAIFGVLYCVGVLVDRWCEIKEWEKKND